MLVRRRGFGVAALAMGLFAVAGAGRAESAESFPSRPIEIIVPAPAGGGLDTATRLLAEVTEPLLGQKIVVVNKAGAAGALGMSVLVQAQPDGHTLGSIYNSPVTITPHLEQVPYTPADYVPILQTDGHPVVFCVRPDFPAKDGKEMMDLFRKNPGKYTYGTDGVGGIVHLAGERVFRTAKVQARPIPFKGSSDTLKNFLGGHVDIYGGTIPAIQPHVKAGKARCLLVSSKGRNEALPDASTLSDIGFPDLETWGWRGLIAPKGVPADRLAILEQAFQKGVRTPRFVEYSKEKGEESVDSNPDRFRTLIQTEYEVFGKILRDIGLAKK